MVKGDTESVTDIAGKKWYAYLAEREMVVLFFPWLCWANGEVAQDDCRCFLKRRGENTGLVTTRVLWAPCCLISGLWFKCNCSWSLSFFPHTSFFLLMSLSRFSLRSCCCFWIATGWAKLNEVFVDSLAEICVSDDRELCDMLLSLQLSSDSSPQHKKRCVPTEQKIAKTFYTGPKRWASCRFRFCLGCFRCGIWHNRWALFFPFSARDRGPLWSPSLA